MAWHPLAIAAVLNERRTGKTFHRRDRFSSRNMNILPPLAVRTARYDCHSIYGRGNRREISIVLNKTDILLLRAGAMKMMRRSLQTISVVMALLTSVGAWAQAVPNSKIGQIRTRGVLRVGMPGDYLPFGLFDASTGQWRGIDVDEVTAMANALGVKLEIVKTSWPNLLKDLEDDRFDIGAGGISVTLKRAETAFYSVPILHDGKTAIARCEDAKQFAGLSDIDNPNVRVITPPGGTNEEFDRSHLKRAEIIVFADNAKIFDELSNKRADVMITDATEAEFQQKQHPDLCAIDPEHPFNFSEKAYLLPQDTAWKEWVDQFLELQKGSGELAKTIERWTK
jgi:cyclohexadienyl dehydratase